MHLKALTGGNHGALRSKSRGTCLLEWRHTVPERLLSIFETNPSRPDFLDFARKGKSPSLCILPYSCIYHVYCPLAPLHLDLLVRRLAYRISNNETNLLFLISQRFDSLVMTSSRSRHKSFQISSCFSLRACSLPSRFYFRHLPSCCFHSPR